MVKLHQELLLTELFSDCWGDRIAPWNCMPPPSIFIHMRTHAPTSSRANTLLLQVVIDMLSAQVRSNNHNHIIREACGWRCGFAPFLYGAMHTGNVQGMRLRPACLSCCCTHMTLRSSSRWYFTGQRQPALQLIVVDQTRLSERLSKPRILLLANRLQLHLS